MIISEVIELLKEARYVHGDIELKLFHPYGDLLESPAIEVWTDRRSGEESANFTEADAATP